MFEEPILAEAGSNLKARQVKSLTYWRDFVSDLEGKAIWSINYQKLLLCFSDEDPANLTGLLQYLTGASAIPPLGFPVHPTITFNNTEDARKPFPIVSTCALNLMLPFADDYETFKKNFKAVLQFNVFSSC